MIAFAIAMLAGLLTGLLTGAGIGGGTLLVLYLTVIAQAEQSAAQGTNLLYFLVTAPPALYSHFKNGLIDIKAALFAAVPGCAAATACALIAGGAADGLLKKAFGVLFIAVGVKELLTKKKAGGGKA